MGILIKRKEPIPAPAPAPTQSAPEPKRMGILKTPAMKAQTPPAGVVVKKPVVQVPKPAAPAMTPPAASKPILKAEPVSVPKTTVPPTPEGMLPVGTRVEFTHEWEKGYKVTIQGDKGTVMKANRAQNEGDSPALDLYKIALDTPRVNPTAWVYFNQFKVIP